jgi:hypothetical protein
VKIVFSSSTGTTPPSGNFVAFDAVERNGKVLIADSVLKEYDPLTGVAVTVIASEGVIPSGQPLICRYRDRIILAGLNHVWYASRQGDPTDWDFAADMNDAGRAVAGELERAGGIGEKATALIAFGDSALLFASQNAMWLLRGDPTTGTVVRISDQIGVLAPTAWARSPEGVVTFLSNDGLYLTTEGTADHPKRFGEDRVPDELLDLSATDNVICMAYDARGRGYHLFVTPKTPAENLGHHWWIDADNKAMWPVYLQAGHQPTAVSRIQGASGGLRDVILGCADGYLRTFSDVATTDDGTAIESHILLGPIRLTSDDMTDAILAELHGIMADNAGAVTWRIVSANSAEVAADLAVAGVEADLAGTTITGVLASGTWAENRNKVDRPRVRGPWLVVWLSASTPWAYEAVALKINQLGRLR